MVETRQLQNRNGSVTVIMAAKNAALFIGEAIQSVLAQTAGVLEIIVVDDGSSDDTASIVRDIEDNRVSLIANIGEGVSAARNLGAKRAQGDWLMFLDADDRLRIDAISRLLSAASPDLVLVYGDYDLIDSRGASIGRRRMLKGRQKPAGQILERLVAGNFIVNGGIMLIRRDAFFTSGGFDEALKYCEDWHCWCRLAAIGPVGFVSAIILDYRLHSSNTMNAATRKAEDFFPALEKIFCDDIISKVLPEKAKASLYKSAEAHLLTYAATQAVRYRRFYDALIYMNTIAQRSPRSLPRSAAKLGLACIGI